MRIVLGGILVSLCALTSACYDPAYGQPPLMDPSTPVQPYDDWEARHYPHDHDRDVIHERPTHEDVAPVRHEEPMMRDFDRPPRPIEPPPRIGPRR